jgi:hypothetical protein
MHNVGPVAALAFLIYAAMMAAILAKIWYEYIFYRDHLQKTEATRYLATFNLVLFILSCVVVGISVLGFMFGSAFMLPFARTAASRYY